MDKPLRVMLDTNVYGIVVGKETDAVLTKARDSHRTIFYGFSVVRKELRAIPSKWENAEGNFRSLLLDYYDKLIGVHTFVPTKRLESLAQQYSDEYSGGISKRKLWNDFLIVACASVHNLDIIVSEDKHSMQSELALKVYDAVNSKYGLKTPVIHSIKAFEKLL